jgi:hypothetical protein
VFGDRLKTPQFKAQSLHRVFGLEAVFEKWVFLKWCQGFWNGYSRLRIDTKDDIVP